jgi:hypothetical protein
LLFKKNAVGSKGEVMYALYRRKLADERGQVFSEQRLSARKAQFADTERHRDADEALNLFKRKDMFAALEFYVLGHAIEATDVTAVRYADAKTVVDAGVLIDQRLHGEGLHGGIHYILVYATKI